MEKWLKERLWEIVIVIGGGLLAFGTLQAQVTEARNELTRLEDMPVTVARIEEKIDRLKESLGELKEESRELRGKVDDAKRTGSRR
jgi:predicted nuclease with TOPRIM domain